MHYSLVWHLARINMVMSKNDQTKANMFLLFFLIEAFILKVMTGLILMIKVMQSSAISEMVQSTPKQPKVLPSK